MKEQIEIERLRRKETEAKMAAMIEEIKKQKTFISNQETNMKTLKNDFQKL